MDDPSGLSGQMRDMRLDTTAATTPPVATQNSFQEAMGASTQSAEKCASLARRVAGLKIDNEDDITSMESSHVHSPHREAVATGSNGLVIAVLETNEARETTARSAIQRFEALACKSPDIKRLFACCQPTLVHLATKVLDSWNGSHELVLARIAEACFKETEWKGELDTYDCINKLSLPIAEAESWPAFWRNVLRDCPRGSTLFDTTACQARLPVGQSFDDKYPPRYLFRVFDGKSRGRNYEYEVASQATCSVDEPDKSKSDLFSTNGDIAPTKMLYKHLTSRHFKPDNLVSWTSSLLFAIQYAVYRCQYYETPPADVKICAVDMTKFPRGQFVRDLHLIRVYNNNYAPNFVPGSHDFFDFRLRDARYRNGEYLSQGVVNLTGRSCVTSLKALASSGLYKLYPEFEDPKGKNKWANRVLELRRKWVGERSSTAEEGSTARKIAEACFPTEMSEAMAWMLLCFKDRADRVAASRKFNSVRYLGLFRNPRGVIESC